MGLSSQTSTSMNENEVDPSISIGRFYAHPPPGEEVCITGVSGAFPNSSNVGQLKEQLFNKVDMVTDDERRWNHFHHEIPKRSGKIFDVEKFDPGFFGIHYRHVESMDPNQRIALEKAVECIFDAGLHPSELEGTKTGIFFGCCFVDSEKKIFFEDIESGGKPILGGLRSMLAHRISNFFKVKGPSYIVDSACSSSLYAIENAYKNIRDGACDMAIVGACNLCLNPSISLHFARLGLLSADGICKAFDESGNGYCRSEAVCCIFLQKKKYSRRIYAKVVHAKTNCDGFKDLGITYPSGEMQMQLLKEFYEECQVDPLTINYVETHGTGTQVGDTEEGSAIDKVFCCNRDKPLMIGSVKSNIGHTEATSGLSSVVKCLIAMEEGHIPPNIHFNTPRRTVRGLIEGRMKVVVEKTPLPDNKGVMAVSSFGFGGANGHLLLEWNHKAKLNGSRPNDDLPRLVCVSGRTSEAVFCLLDSLSGSFDTEYIQLLYEIFKKNIECHNHRGYSIESKTGQISASCRRYFEVRPKLLLIFGDFGNSWRRIANHLLVLPVFAKTIKSIHQILIDIGMSMTDILQNSSTASPHPVVNYILGSVALKIGIMELLKSLKVEPNAIMGVATGEIVCAYFDGFLTLKETILTAYEIANHLKVVSRFSTSYLVKFVEKEALQHLPSNVEIIWKYSDNTAAISGETKVVHQFMTDLQNKEVDVIKFGYNDVTVHSRNNARIESALLQKLEMIITNPKSKIKLWIPSSSEPISLPEYLVKSLYSEVNLESIMSTCSGNSILLEIGQGRLSTLLNQPRCMDLEVISFNSEKSNNGFVAFLEILGSIYMSGFNPQIQNLYPNVQYPVSRTTPMISDKIKWEHSENWHVARYTDIKQSENYEKTITICPKTQAWQYTKGHVIDGRNLFPATGYIDMVWQTFAAAKETSKTDMAVLIDNSRFFRATTINERLDFTINMQKKSGNFQIIEDQTEIVNGKIRMASPAEMEQFSLPFPRNNKRQKVLNMDCDDIYRELRLKGYHYKDEFQLMKKCNMNATRAYIKWTGNWVTFMDNMLQVKLLQYDTRQLYVPIAFRRIIIDAKKHLDYVHSFGENPTLPVYNYKEEGIVRCGGIEIRGISTSSIARRKLMKQPLLETYEFVPNETSVTLLESLRINIHIALENLHTFQFVVTEMFDDDTGEYSEPLASFIYEIFLHHPLTQANITILTKKDVEIENVTVKKIQTLPNKKDCHLVIGTDLLQRPSVLNQAFGALRENGFILSREKLDFSPSLTGQGKVRAIDIVTMHTTENEKMILFRKSSPTRELAVAEIPDSDDNFSWLALLQNTMDSHNNILVYAQNAESNGLLGLHNCLRKEAGGTNLQCFLMHGKEAPPFDHKDPFYKKQLDKNMSVNIFKDGKWGTYRHLPLRENEEVESEHCFVNQTVKGDFSNMKFVHGPLNSKSELPIGKTLVHVYYASLNFKDILISSGSINPDIMTMSRLEEECNQGFEFVGRDCSGKRVMGIAKAALSSLVMADSVLLFKVPKNWTMEEAATVPVIYSTVLYSLFERAKIRKGESILIHSGAGGIGQAAIHVALALKCNVFTTVGTPEKREFLKKLFPQLKGRQIGNSRDSTFEMMVKNETSGRGVDVVLNSLTEEKLIASVRCLAKGGRFLELGKFDIVKDNPLALSLLDRGCSFHGVMLDQLFCATVAMKKIIISLVNQGIESGIVKPIAKNIFQMNELEEAYRFMFSGKHIGKVIIKIREEEAQIYKHIPSVFRIKGLPRFYCCSEKSYIILGGLGGFGMELANWLVLRGARKLILVSRFGIRTGYQAFNINIWKSYGVIVEISTVDITTRDGCERLITEAESLGTVDGLFNLAVVLKDSLFQNQTSETFRMSFAPKVTATKYLDDITRRRCSQLRYFVVFSSVTCGRGNTGQTNYGMANSAMEKICENRRRAGYPALAIQWGIVGDVGLVAETKMKLFEPEVVGTLQQEISSCLQVMDTFLNQKQATVVSSLVMADKKRGNCLDNIVDVIANVLGITKTTVSPHTTLAELGMDSLSAVEIKQTLEKDFEIFLSPQEIRTLTFSRLQEIQGARDAHEKENKQPTESNLLLKNIGDEFITNIPVVRLPSLAEDDSDAPLVFFFPGIDGYLETMRPLAAQLKAKVVGLQCCLKVPASNITTTAEECLGLMEIYLKLDNFVNLVSFSWGTVIALEVTTRLEKRGHKVNLIILDGSPDFVRENTWKYLKATTETEMHISVLCMMLQKFHCAEHVAHHKKLLTKCSTTEERTELFMEAMKDVSYLSPAYKRTIAIAIYIRVKECSTYEASYGTVLARTKLMKPRSPLYETMLPEDYNLSTICLNLQEIKYFEGNHVSMLDNELLADAINESFY